MRSRPERSPDPPGAAPAKVELRPRWLWIAFTVLAIAVPLLGLVLEWKR